MLYLLEGICCKNDTIIDTRIFGVFTEDKLTELRDIIINNKSDLWEFYYKYMVIIKIPENILYVDCCTELFELYKILMPQEYVNALEAKKSKEELNQIIKENFNKIKFVLLNEKEIPEFISKYFDRIHLQEEK